MARRDQETGNPQAAVGMQAQEESGGEAAGLQGGAMARRQRRERIRQGGEEAGAVRRLFESTAELDAAMRSRGLTCLQSQIRANRRAPEQVVVELRKLYDAGTVAQILAHWGAKLSAGQQAALLTASRSRRRRF